MYFRSPARQLFLALIAFVILGACTDPFRPGDAPGTYVLHSVQADPVPAFFRRSDIVDIRVLSDTLTLNADGTGHEIWHLEFIQQTRTTATRVERPLRFEVQGERMEGAYLCPPDSGCLAVIQPIRGEFTRTGLRLDVAMFAAGPLLFRRADR